MHRPTLHVPVPIRPLPAFHHIGFAVGAPIPATILRCAGPRNCPCRLSPRCTPKPCGLHRPNRRQSRPRSVLRRSFLHSFSNITGKTCIPYSRVLEGQHLSVHLFSRLALARTSTVNHHYILEAPAKCPNCRQDIYEKTLVEPGI